MSEIPFTQEDRDLLVRHDVKMVQLCTSVKDLKKDMRVGFTKIGEKLDAGIVACPTNRANCRKEVDKEMDDERKLVDEKIAKKVDWLHLKIGSGIVVAVVGIIFGILKYTA